MSLTNHNIAEEYKAFWRDSREFIVNVKWQARLLENGLVEVDRIIKNFIMHDGRRLS